MTIEDKDLQEIALLASQFSEGQHMPRQVCPVCNGGSHGERSFVLRRTARGVKFMCFRASCPTHGHLDIRGTSYHLNLNQPPKTFEPQIFKHPTQSLNGDYAKYFEEWYGIEFWELLENRVVYCPARSSFVFPARNLSGDPVGVQERWFRWQKGIDLSRKAKYWPHKDEPVSYRPRFHEHSWDGDWRNTLVIVEDTLSAIKTARHAPTIALLGTHLTERLVAQLQDMEYKTLIFALDPDAIAKALGYQKTLACLFKVKVLFLDDDPKDTPSQVLRQKLYEL